MKLKSIVTLALLFVLGFSMIHEYAFTIFDPEPCSVTEYVQEFDAPTHVDDLCDAHYEYHHAYMLPQNDLFAQTDFINYVSIPENYSYTFKTYLKTIIPPIV